MGFVMKAGFVVILAGVLLGGVVGLVGAQGVGGVVRDVLPGGVVGGVEVGGIWRGVEGAEVVEHKWGYEVTGWALYGDGERYGGRFLVDGGIVRGMVVELEGGKRGVRGGSGLWGRVHPYVVCGSGIRSGGVVTLTDFGQANMRRVEVCESAGGGIKLERMPDSLRSVGGVRVSVGDVKF